LSDFSLLFAKREFFVEPLLAATAAGAVFEIGAEGFVEGAGDGLGDDGNEVSEAGEWLVAGGAEAFHWERLRVES
jgi:hypothetical protein